MTENTNSVESFSQRLQWTAKYLLLDWGQVLVYAIKKADERGSQELKLEP